MNTTDHTYIDNLITDCLTHQASDGDYERLSAWMDESEGNRVYVRQQIETWQAACMVSSDYDSEAAWARLHPAEPKLNVVSRRWRAIAAVALLVLLPLAGYLIGSYMNRVPQNMLSAVTGMAGKVSFSLPDGTKVWLNHGSRLEWNQSFGLSNRDVRILGEGYFEVSHNASLPFRVLTKEIQLTVLGTKFNFRNYANSDTITADLLEGHVQLALNHGQQTMDLQPNERITYDRSTHRMTKSICQAEDAKTWTLKRFNFEDATVSEIMHTLALHYEVEIQVAPAVAQQRFYYNIDFDYQGLDEILRNMAATGKIHVRWTDSGYYIY